MSMVCAPANISAVGHTGKIRRQNGFGLANLTYAANDSVVTFRPFKHSTECSKSELRQMHHPHLLYAAKRQRMLCTND